MELPAKRQGAEEGKPARAGAHIGSLDFCRSGTVGALVLCSLGF